MFKSLFGGTIYSRVMAAIQQRIAQAEREHEEHCQQLDEQHEQTVLDLEAKRDAAKEAHADSMVASILGKVL